MKRLQLVSTNLLDSVKHAARGNKRFRTKFCNHCIKFKVVYFISTKDKALTILVKFVQDFVMPLGFRLLHLRADGRGDFIVDYYRDGTGVRSCSKSLST